MLAEQQRYDEAADVFELAIDLVPRDPGARHGLLSALGGLRRHDEVLRAARVWVEDYPDEPQAWRSVALALAADAREVAFHVQDQIAWMTWRVAANVRISGYRDPVPATDYSDWRWLTDRADSPWYPTLRLFQQRASGDWTNVAQDVERRLARVAAGELPAVWPV